MYIRLIRNQPKGNAITGRLVIDGRWFCDTLERVGYQIPALCYPIRVTQSPKFKRLLPLVTGVPRSIVQNGVEVVQNGSAVVQNGSAMVQNGSELSSTSKQPLNHSTQFYTTAKQPLNYSTPSGMRTGIRFHVGTKPEHSTGCILLVADNWHGVEWCRMVQDGVELSSLKTNNATQPYTTLHNSKPPQGRTAADVEKQLTDLILKAQNEHEEIILEVTDFTHGTEYGYNTQCPPELQMP